MMPTDQMDWVTVNQLIATKRWMVANHVGASALRAYMEKQGG